MALAGLGPLPAAAAEPEPESAGSTEARDASAPTSEDPAEASGEASSGEPTPDGSVQVPAPDAANAEADSATEERAISLYFAGEEAYNLGDFSAAIERFEGAYALSNKPDLLYNVALAYYRRYETSREVSDLQRARAVLINFEIALKRDPSIGDPQQVSGLMGQIDKELDSAKRAAGGDGGDESSMTETEGPEELTCIDTPLQTEDPGKPSRIAGAASLGVGGLLLAGGAASIAAFTLKGQEFENTLVTLQTQQRDEGCDAGVNSQRCELLQQSIDTTIANGRQANILAATLGTSLTVFGVAGVITGAVVYAQGNKRSREWERQRTVQVAPGLGALLVRGRF